MGLSSSKILLLLFFISVSVFGQDIDDPNDKDYKDKEQFEKFWKRRKVVGAWQINQLKKGALVIKLRTHRNLIAQLEKAGKKELAKQKRLEVMVINKSTMLAFMDQLNFCKVYFIYSHDNDTLLNGARKGIFLDTNLQVDPNIEMKESFYLVAERDRVYNSSIGFVPEDSARLVKEKGNPNGYDLLAVVKNKYGHQLKKPFPLVCGYGVKNSGALNSAFVKALPVYYFESEQNYFNITIDKTQLADLNHSEKKEFKTGPAGASKFLLSKEFAYEILSMSIARFNDELNVYYQASPPPDMERIPQEVKKFFY